MDWDGFLKRRSGVAESMPKNSVLLVSEPIVPGGIAVYTRSIMEGLTQSQIAHPLLTSTVPALEMLPENELEHVQVVSGLFWSFWRPFIFRRLVAWAREREVNLIHGLSALTAPVCARLATALNIPYVVTVHHYQKRGNLAVEKLCKGFIAVSDPLRENMVNDAGLPKEMIRLIPAGIRVPTELRARPAAYQQGSHGSIPLVTSFGKLISRKDYTTFLKAARLIIDRLGNDVSFVISGEGPDESALRKLSRELKIDKQVTFCHGTASHAELLRDTDVYVQCSKIEGFGTMVLQAMAHGVPVVATSTGGILSLIKDGDTGFLVPVGDAEALAARVLNLLTDTELSHRFGEAARQVALTEYNLDSMMASTVALYNEAMAETIASV